MTLVDLSRAFHQSRMYFIRANHIQLQPLPQITAISRNLSLGDYITTATKAAQPPPPPPAQQLPAKIHRHQRSSRFFGSDDLPTLACPRRPIPAMESRRRTGFLPSQSVETCGVAQVPLVVYSPPQGWIGGAFVITSALLRASSDSPQTAFF